MKQKVEADLLEARLSGKELPTPPSVSAMENVSEADSGGLPDLLDGLGLENEVGDGEGGLEGVSGLRHRSSPRHDTNSLFAALCGH